MFAYTMLEKRAIFKGAVAGCVAFPPLSLRRRVESVARDASWFPAPASDARQRCLLGRWLCCLTRPRASPAIPDAQPRQSADFPCTPVVLWMPSLSPVATRVAAEAALPLRSAVLVFSITFGHLLYGVCPALAG